MPFLFSLLFTIACFILFLLCIHYIYDYIKEEFTQPREISMSTNYKRGKQISSSPDTTREYDWNKVPNLTQEEDKKRENEMMIYQTNTLDRKHVIMQSITEEDIKKDVQQDIHVDDELENYFKSLH